MTTGIKPEQTVIAVSASDHHLYGCPHCGYHSGYIIQSDHGTVGWRCTNKDCEKICCILVDGVKISSLNFRYLDGSYYYPNLQAHPRSDTPCYDNPDLRPETGGEFFHAASRFYFDVCPCFICGTKDRDGIGRASLNAIIAKVQCVDAAHRIVKMVGRGARPVYRRSAPDKVQVRIAACDAHLPNLQKLYDSLRDNIITIEQINEAKEYSPE